MQFMQEVELKFLEIDVEKMIAKLQEIGATQVFSETMQSASFFSDRFIPANTSCELLRVRKIGDTVQITYKTPVDKSSSAKSREEKQIITSDFEKTIDLISTITNTTVFRSQKHRIHFTYEDLAFEIDTVPGVPPYLEIEAPSEKRMNYACTLLSLHISQGKADIIPNLYPGAMREPVK